MIFCNFSENSKSTGTVANARNNSNDRESPNETGFALRINGFSLFLNPFSDSAPAVFLHQARN